LQAHKSTLLWKLSRQIYQPYIFIGTKGGLFNDA
jgi:hypothetical protein